MHVDKVFIIVVHVHPKRAGVCMAQRKQGWAAHASGLDLVLYAVRIQRLPDLRLYFQRKSLKKKFPIKYHHLYFLRWMSLPASVFTARDGPSPATDGEIRDGLPLPETASRQRFVRLSGRLCNAVPAAAVIIAVPADRLTAHLFLIKHL